jgi:hypothetical protein
MKINFFKEDTLNWLMEYENPSVRYFTLRDLLDKRADDPEVLKTKTFIMLRGPVARILSKQTRDGFWKKREDFYLKSKYKGTSWQIAILAELGASGKDDGIKQACEFILKHSQDVRSGGFAMQSSTYGGGDHNKICPCYTSNMVYSLLRFGYLHDPRVRKAISWLCKYQRFDDGDTRAPSEWPYRGFEQCWGKHTCFFSVIKTLRAFAEIPEQERTDEVIAIIKTSAEYMLAHHIFKQSHNLSEVSKPLFLKFSFPLIWHSDALEVMDLLTKLGYRDDRMIEAIELILSKQGDSGRWNLENTFNGRMLVNIERLKRPSKWITLSALRVLKRYYSSTID